ncbi:SGNH/GDSL hydrolase family protein [Spongiactinospora gelatinilytica]|uniref:SGNH/GDSL hydrolase family protein n=1 Tax=Spongiactinospora gelatinilytica TaxID=2666298 RepID=UPI001F2A95BA|nr:SGNH/GDSL hydrolase family protein [Spongiactinospora gelatinilytica]
MRRRLPRGKGVVPAARGRVLRRRLAAVAGAAVLLVAGCGGAAPEPNRTTRVSPPSVTHRAPVVMAVGDSFTVGSGPVRSWNTYLAAAARQLGWQPVIAGAAGTGYLNRGKAGRNFLASFTEELAWRPAPDLLIVSGGHNDRRWSPARVSAACHRLLTTVKKQWPRTRVIVIGPIWMTAPPSWAEGVKGAVSSAARRAKVPFLDPLPELATMIDQPEGAGAVDEVAKQPDARSGGSELVLPDGVHPTLLGHRRLGKWLVDSLRSMPLSG